MEEQVAELGWSLENAVSLVTSTIISKEIEANYFSWVSRFLVG